MLFRSLCQSRVLQRPHELVRRFDRLHDWRPEKLFLRKLAPERTDGGEVAESVGALGEGGEGFGREGELDDVRDEVGGELGAWGFEGQGYGSRLSVSVLSP